MKKGLIGFLAMSTLFSLAVVGNSNKVEAAESYIKASDIQLGDTVVLVYESASMEMQKISTTSTKYGMGVAYSGSPAGVYPLTVVEGNSAGTYALQNEAGQYLYWSTGNSLNTNATLSANTSWTIEFDGDGDAIIINGKDSTRKLQWNASSPRFACYTGSQKDIQIYKLDDGNSGEEPIEKTPTEEVNELLNSYYNSGNYLRRTEINLNEEARNELVKCFHAESNLLVRDTYFVGEHLWMTNEEETYSYYGTRGSDMTGGRSAEALVQPKKVHIAQTGVTMEQKYTTMLDIKGNEAEWTKEGDVYSTSDADVIQMFLDFTAPCFLGLNETNKNYWSMTSVQVEETENGLELRLITEGDEGKLTDANGVLSVATITKTSNSITWTQYQDAPTTEKLVVEGTVVSRSLSDNEDKGGFVLDDGNGNLIKVYKPDDTNVKVKVGDKVSVDGKLTGTGTNKRFSTGSKVEITEESGFVPSTLEVTVENAVEIELEEDYIAHDTYIVSGTVIVANSSYYLTDGTNQIKLLSGNATGLHEGCEAKITGDLANNGEIVFVNYTAEITKKAVHTVTVNCGENGSYEISSNTVEHESDVTITVTPNTGYVVDSVKANGSTVLPESENTYKYNVKADTTIVISFVEESQGGEPEAEKVTVSKTVADLITEYGWTSSTTKQSFTLDDVVSVKIDGGSNTGKAYSGNHIRIYATDSPAGTITISLAEGYELVSIKISTQTGTYAYLYVEGNTTDISNLETDVSGNSVVLNSVKNGTDGKQVRVTGFEVTYIKTA